MRGRGVGALIIGLLVPACAWADGRCTPHTQRESMDVTWTETGYSGHSRYDNFGSRSNHTARINLEWTCEYKYDCTASITIDDLMAGVGAREHGTNDWHPLYQHIIARGHAGPGTGTCSGFKCEADTDLAVGYAVATCAFGNCSLNISSGIALAGGVFSGGFEFAAGGTIPWKEGQGLLTGVGYGKRHRCGANAHQVIAPPGGGGGGCLVGAPGSSAMPACDEPTCNSQERSDCISNCGDWHEDICTCYMPPGGCGCIPEERSICEQENGDFDEETCTCRY